jgi:hypothetical protein
VVGGCCTGPWAHNPKVTGPNRTPATKDGVILGGIGVGGYPSGRQDEDLARVGLEAMNVQRRAMFHAIPAPPAVPQGCDTTQRGVSYVLGPDVVRPVSVT